MKNHITLAGKEYSISPIPLGLLKVALPAFGRVGVDFANGDLTERTFDDLIIILAAGMEMTTEEVDKIVAPMDDLIVAIEKIATVSGLIKGGGDPGEASPAAVSIGTSSTAG